MLTVFLHFMLILALSFIYSAPKKKTILCNFKLIRSEQMRGSQFTEEIITLLLYGKINKNKFILNFEYRCLL